ncbi:hypothetical protein KKE48_01975 [Patescibacteria group bacterium]|nr:hypothetical protein [Patescibacteria group bacterium]MBU1499617.1 hypothetical protein [Patescibacteria group bacterium]
MNSEIRNQDFRALRIEDLQAFRFDAELAFVERMAQFKKLAKIERRILWTDQPSRDGIHRRGPTRATK